MELRWLQGTARRLAKKSCFRLTLRTTLNFSCSTYNSPDRPIPPMRLAKGKRRVAGISLQITRHGTRDL